MLNPFLAVVAAYLCGFVWFAFVPAARPAATPPKADAIIVFTGGSNRIAEGLRLLDQGRAPRLMITGVPPGATLAETLDLPEARAAPYADRVTLGPVATTTYGNALETRDWVRKYRLNSLILVTSDYHLPRALVELRGQVKAEVAVHPWPVRASAMQRQGWWARTGLITLLFGEYNKMLVVYLRRVITG